MKNFFKNLISNWEWLLPTYRGPLGFGGAFRHYVYILITVGIPYTVLLHNQEMFQTVEKYYLPTAITLLLSIGIGYVLQVILRNLFKDYIFYYPKLDVYFYILGFIITYLVTNEIFGL